MSSKRKQPPRNKELEEIQREPKVLRGEVSAAEVASAFMPLWEKSNNPAAWSRIEFQSDVARLARFMRGLASAGKFIRLISSFIMLRASGLESFLRPMTASLK